MPQKDSWKGNYTITHSTTTLIKVGHKLRLEGEGSEPVTGGIFESATATVPLHTVDTGQHPANHLGALSIEISGTSFQCRLYLQPMKTKLGVVVAVEVPSAGSSSLDEGDVWVAEEDGQGDG